MTEFELHRTMYAVVSLSCADLSDLELAVLNNCAQLDIDPRNRRGSEKFLHLFDTTDSAGVPRMHSETKQALARIVLERLT